MAGNDIDFNFKTNGADSAIQDIESLEKALDGVSSSSGGTGGGAADGEISSILSNIKKVSAELKKAGTSEAKEINATLENLASILSPEKLSADAINDIGRAVETLLRQTDKLPPKGFVSFGRVLTDLAEHSAEVAREMAKFADVEFRVSDEGLASLDSIRHKLDVIANVQGLDAGIRELEDALQTLDEGEAKKIQSRIDDIRKLLSGDLDSGQIKKLEEESRRLSKELDGLKTASLARVGDSGANVLRDIGQLKDSLDVTQRNAQELQAVASEVFERMGVSIGMLDGNLARFAARIPGIGKALAALRTAIAGPFGWILALVGAIGGAIMSWATAFQEARSRVERIKFDNVKSTIDAIKEDTERYIHLLDLAAEKRRNEKQIMDEQLEAQHQINGLMLERQKLAMGRAGMSEQDRFDIEQKAKKEEGEATIYKDRRKLELDKKHNEEDMADLDAKIKQLEEDAKQYRRSAGKLGVDSVALMRKHDGFFENAPLVGDFFGKFTGAEADAELSKEKADEAKQLWRDYKEAMKEIEQLKVQRKSLSRKGFLFSEEEARINQQEKLNSETLTREMEEENLRRTLAMRERQREMEVRERDEAEQESEYVRNRDSWMKSVDEKLQDAADRVAKFGEQADKATAEMERLEKANKDNADWTEADRRRYEEAKEDRSRAMGLMRSAQEEVDSYNREAQETAWSEEARLRSQSREDADFERQKKYDRAGWDGKVAMEEAKLKEAQQMRQEAEKALLNRAGMSAHQIALLEEQRDVGRSREVEARSNLHSLALEGDRDTAAFEAKMRGEGGNRLTAMGLGGDAVDFSRHTARNTARLVEINREMLGKFAGGPHTGVAGRLGEVSWTMR